MHCGGGRFIEVDLGAAGVVETWTVVHRAPGDMPAPYACAYVRLPADVRVFGVLVTDADVRVGDPVVVVAPPPGAQDSTVHFAPAERAPGDGRAVS